MALKSHSKNGGLGFKASRWSEGEGFSEGEGCRKEREAGFGGAVVRGMPLARKSLFQRGNFEKT